MGRVGAGAVHTQAPMTLTQFNMSTATDSVISTNLFLSCHAGFSNHKPDPIGAAQACTVKSYKQTKSYGTYDHFLV